MSVYCCFILCRTSAEAGESLRELSDLGQGNNDSKDWHGNGFGVDDRS